MNKMERLVLLAACILTLCNHILAAGIAGVVLTVIIFIYLKATATTEKEIKTI